MTLLNRNAIHALAAIAVLGLAPGVAAAQTPGQAGAIARTPAATRQAQPHAAKTAANGQRAGDDHGHRWQAADRGDHRPGRQAFRDRDERGDKANGSHQGDRRSRKDGGEHRRG